MPELYGTIEEYFGTPLYILVRVIVGTSWMPYFIGDLHFVGFVLWVVTGSVAGFLANKKGRNPFLWGFFAGLFWGIGFVALSLASIRQSEEMSVDDHEN